MFRESQSHNGKDEIIISIQLIKQISYMDFLSEEILSLLCYKVIGNDSQLRLRK